MRAGLIPRAVQWSNIYILCMMLIPQLLQYTKLGIADIADENDHATEVEMSNPT